MLMASPVLCPPLLTRMDIHQSLITRPIKLLKQLNGCFWHRRMYGQIKTNTLFWNIDFDLYTSSGYHKAFIWRPQCWFVSIDNSAVQIPTVHIPFWGSLQRKFWGKVRKKCRPDLHIKTVVDGEFLSFSHIETCGDGRYKSVARVFSVRPLAVGDEAVVQLVCQGGGVVLRGVELVRKNEMQKKFKNKKSDREQRYYHEPIFLNPTEPSTKHAPCETPQQTQTPPETPEHPHGHLRSRDTIQTLPGRSLFEFNSSCWPADFILAIFVVGRWNWFGNI